MPKKFLLLDTYLNETRVALVKDSVLEDFDDEFSSTKLKKGNIYIGRIMRIEPSLQAAFVDFGFEKHGFLAFSEICPNENLTTPIPVKPDAPLPAEPSASVTESGEVGDSEEEERPVRPIPPIGKIQDLLKRQQLVMVQVIKDARGSKGAALTTYLSFPGRYCFLLPNTPKSSGVSKKIADADERKALKLILTGLEMPDTMSVILRSASMGKKKSEIKRDYDYLTKLWEKIAHHPLDQIGLIYEEHDLLIRSLRDLYSSDIDEVFIQGDDAFKRAKSYIRSVFPSHIKKIKQHTDPVGLFEKFKIESQIKTIYDHTVTLPSGGSIVINPTEALVSIDVNSSKSTQGRSIEDTALKTNLEATVAIARNLRLRDLAGLIVIDFIDLHPNKRPVVEKAMKDALSMDRARLKIGKISEFGLLEMSRQRLRQSLMESNTLPCPSCHGSGRLLSLSMQSMEALRAIERTMSMATGPEIIQVSGSEELVLCLLNDHRKFLCDIEKKYSKTIRIAVSKILFGESFSITPDLLAAAAAAETAAIQTGKKNKRQAKATEALSEKAREDHDPFQPNQGGQDLGPQKKKGKHHPKNPKSEVLDSDLGGMVLLPTSGKNHRKQNAHVRTTPDHPMRSSHAKQDQKDRAALPVLDINPISSPTNAMTAKQPGVVVPLDIGTKKKSRPRRRGRHAQNQENSSTLPTIATASTAQDFNSSIPTLGPSANGVLDSALPSHSIPHSTQHPIPQNISAPVLLPHATFLHTGENGAPSDKPATESRRARLRKRRQVRAHEQAIQSALVAITEQDSIQPLSSRGAPVPKASQDVLPSLPQPDRPMPNKSASQPAPKQTRKPIPKKVKKGPNGEAKKSSDTVSSIVLLPRTRNGSHGGKI